MRIGIIEPEILSTHFKVAFRHASATRTAMQSLLVRARSLDGLEGMGEGCPREYVTNENLDSAHAFVTAHRNDWIAAVNNVAELGLWAERRRDVLDENPAAWCAVELALLDLFGRGEQKSIESLMGLPPLSGQFRYTAVLGDVDAQQFAQQLRGYLDAGFRDFKVKLSGDRDRDFAKASALEAAGIAASHIRVDANNRWRHADDAIAHLASVRFPCFAVEEPVAPRDYAGLRKVAHALGVKVILDESATRLADLEPVRRDPGLWIVNVRVSKMGGVARSLAFVRGAMECGVSVVVGAHVGESSLLTRAALCVAHGAQGGLVAQEGAFGTHLLHRDLVDPPLMFGPGGMLDSVGLDGPGLCLQRHATISKQAAGQVV